VDSQSKIQSAALLICFLLGLACLPVENPKTALVIENRTGQQIWLSYLDEDNRVIRISDYPTRPGGHVTFYVGSPSEKLCTPGPVIARTRDGDEIARRENLCPFETWVVRE
jgi:hypothetical protein